MFQALPALLILGFRASSVFFLLLYPISSFLWRILSKPWITTPLKEGLHYVLQPLALLEAKRLYHETVAELEPRLEPLDNINEASFAQLCELEGVGATRAHDILAYRDEYGPFRRMEELGLIKGVGAKTFRLLCEHFEVPEESQRLPSSRLSYERLSAQLIEQLPLSSHHLISPPAHFPNGDHQAQLNQDFQADIIIDISPQEEHEPLTQPSSLVTDDD